MYLSRIVSYYFENKHIDVLDTCRIRYMYCYVHLRLVLKKNLRHFFLKHNLIKKY